MYNSNQIEQIQTITYLKSVDNKTKKEEITMCFNPLKMIFGGNGGQKIPVIQQSAPPPTTTNVGDSTGDTAITDSIRKARRKRGFSSTNLKDWQSQNSSILGGNKTLG